MRALTVRQPWAWAIAAGYKTVENRWHGTAYRGPLAIHSSRDWSDVGAENPHLAAAWGRHMGLSVPCHPMRYPDLFPEGAFVAVVDLVDVHKAGTCCLPWGEPSYYEAHGFERPNRYWVLKRPATAGRAAAVAWPAGAVDPAAAGRRAAHRPHRRRRRFSPSPLT